MPVGFAGGLVQETGEPLAGEKLSRYPEQLTGGRVRFPDYSVRVGEEAGIRRELEQLEVLLTFAVDSVSRREQLLVLKSVRISTFSWRFTRVSDRALLLGVHHLRHLG
jgi:hypothetical protein